MSNKETFGEKLDRWIDTAGDYLDNLTDSAKDNGYVDRLKDATRSLDRAARASKEDVREEMHGARKHLKEQSQQILDRLDGWVDRVQQQARQTGDISKEQLERFKERANRLREDIKYKAERTEDELKGRSDRFSDGIDRILDDLRTNNAAGGSNVTGTSPIDHEGDYDAANAEGTINNYSERLQEHTAATKERIRDRVEDAEESFREKLEEATRKF